MLIPIIISTKDSELLNILLKGDHLLLSHQDCLSFITWSLRENWTQGLRVFLTSSSVHFYYQSFTHENQKELIHQIVNTVFYQTSDQNTR